MQPWHDQGQNGADGHDSWHSNFIFSAPTGQFDPSQEQWPDQPMGGQGAAFSQIGHDLPDASAQDYDFDPVHHGAAGAFLGDEHLTNPQPAQAGFHGAATHGSMPLGQHQQFSAANQDILDPTFTNIHPDLFGSQQQQHQGKVNIAGAGIGGAGIGQIAVGQGHNHGQVFAQHDYSFTPQGGQPFGSSPDSAQNPQYTPPPLMPRPGSSRQQSHTPLQQHLEGDNLHAAFPANQAFARPPQQTPLHHPQQPQQQQPPRPFSDQPFASSANGQPDHYQVGPHAHMPYPQFADQSHLQQARFSQASFAPQKANAFQPVPGSVGPVTIDERQARQSQAAGQQNPSAVGHAQLAMGQLAPVETNDLALAKKRKRPTRNATEAASAESPAPLGPELQFSESVARKADDVVSLQAPVPSAEESSLLAESAKRLKPAQRKLPATKALPFLAHCGSIKLPVPKSYDKLAPLVAIPSRSGKPAVPGLGYDLPCEIQGRFTSQYRPSFDKPGLDERREEAKVLLDNYDRSMKALGKRQPKYTEYPHAFKEQLKADEASKNKAEKRAKKEQEEERNKPIRAPLRPADPSAAAAWDIIGIVRIDQAVPRTNALIAGRVQQAGEYLITLRGDANRAKLSLDQAVKDKKPDAETATLRLEAERKKETLYEALDAIVEHADDAVLDNLGGHQKLVLSLVNTLISCIKAGDFSGKLAKIVLEIFTHLTMTKKIVETTNFDTVRKRLEDKGDEEVKDLVREISSKVRKFTRANESDTATGYTGTSAASRAKAGTRSSAAGAGDGSSSKRGRDDDSEGARTVKKIAIEPGNSLLSKKLGQPKSHPQSAARVVGAAAPKQAASILPGKPRPVPKPASKAHDTPAAADSPSTSADEKGKAEAKRAAVKPEAKAATARKETKPSVASSAVSSISSLLDSINAKKPDPVTVTAAASREGKRSQTPETPGQTAKRLRKEARRKLRVSWKPEGELVQIKVFEKDDDEDEGRDMNMIRDAADDRSEGMVLKRRANETMEDEDDDIPYRPWTVPTPVNVSDLPDETRNKSYVTRGGRLVLDTEEQKLMAEREQRELMVIYTDPADIPPTPKSPPPEAAVVAEAKIGRLPEGESMFSEVHLRWKEGEQMGVDQACLAATKRVNPKGSMSTKLDSILGRLHQTGAGSGRQASTSTQAPATSTASEFTNVNTPLAVGPAVEAYVLGWLKWDRIASWRNPNPVHVDASLAHQYSSPEIQAAGKAVEAVATSLAGKPYPASSPPEWLVKDGERVREWWLGYNKEAVARQRKLEESSAMAGAEFGVGAQGSGNVQDWNAYYAQQQQQHQAYAPYMALLQQMTGAQQPQPQPQAQQMVQQLSAAAAALGHQPQILDSQLQSILTAINQPAHAQPGAGGYESGGYDGAHQALSQGQPQASAHGDRDLDRNEAQGGKGEQHRGDAKEGRKKKNSLPPHKPTNKSLIGTKACTFWQQGKCARGDKCTFRHK